MSSRSHCPAPDESSIRCLPSRIDADALDAAVAGRPTARDPPPMPGTTFNTVYAVTSLPAEPAYPARRAPMIRGHWAMEPLPPIRDVTFA